jgi:hypothetical protein
MSGYLAGQVIGPPLSTQCPQIFNECNMISVAIMRWCSTCWKFRLCLLPTVERQVLRHIKRKCFQQLWPQQIKLSHNSVLKYATTRTNFQSITDMLDNSEDFQMSHKHKYHIWRSVTPKILRCMCSAIRYQLEICCATKGLHMEIYWQTLSELTFISVLCSFHMYNG